MPADRKPYGVKRQWHLMPFRQLYQTNPSNEMLKSLADYQDKPSTRTAAALHAAVYNIAKNDLGMDKMGLAERVVQVMEHGNSKYGPDNWKQATSKDEYLSALCRHIFAQETLDPDSALPHVVHAATNALFLMWMEDNLDPEVENLRFEV